MSLKLSELHLLIGKRVVVEMQGTSGTFEIEGNVRSADTTGIVLLAKEGPSIITISEMIDIYETDAPRPLVRRKLRHIGARQARQHLLDRHGMALDLIRATTAATAFILHEALNHSNLGHQHRPDGEEGDE